MNFLFPFLGSKAIRILFHSSTPFLTLLNSQPPASRLDVCRSIFAIFFFLVAVVVGIFLVFISFSYNLAIENISFSDSHPHKMLQIVPTMRSCCYCCYFSRFFFSSILLWFFSLCLTHTHAERDCRPTNLILLCDIWGMLTTPRKTTDFLVEPQQRVWFQGACWALFLFFSLFLFLILSFCTFLFFGGCLLNRLVAVVGLKSFWRRFDFVWFLQN